MKAYGTEVLLTPAADGFGAAVAKSRRISGTIQLLLGVNSTTEANPAIHYQTTGQKLLNFGGKTPKMPSVVSVLVVRSGVGRALKK